MRWFKHDTDASIDAKLQELILDYGAAGYGLYWYCVELIAQGVNENNITFELDHDARIISRNLNLTMQETKDMMTKMINLGLFSISKNEKLACYALAKRLDQSMTSSPKFRDFIKQIKDNHDGVMINHDLVMNRREEKRREKTRREKNTPLIPQGINREAWDEWVQHRKEIKKPLTPKAMEKQFKLLLEHPYDQKEIIDQSIQNSWQGLFPPKRTPQQRNLAQRNREAFEKYEKIMEAQDVEVLG